MNPEELPNALEMFIGIVLALAFLVLCIFIAYGALSMFLTYYYS